MVCDSRQPPRGQQVTLDDEAFYQIANHDRLRPFFLSIVSAGDHWMFISSTGALTAGRSNPDLALFPYCTDDKIHDSAEVTGSKTVCIVRRRGRHQLWEPFSNRHQGIHQIQRNLYKNLVGNKLVFEEINQSLGLTFRYGWFNSERFGFVRKAWLINSNQASVSVDVLDGLQNLMPCGVASQFQSDKSTLLDAYKRNELLPETGLGLFRLSSIPIDRPEPAEALRTTTVLCLGLKTRAHLLSSVQLDRFRSGDSVAEETDVRAERGAYFVRAKLKLPPHQLATWMLIADVGRDAGDVAALQNLLHRPAPLRRLIEADIARGTEELERLVASADGLQKSACPLGDARHFANVLFNIMRGGVFPDGYHVAGTDVHHFVQNANHDVATRHIGFFRSLGGGLDHRQLLTRAAATNDPQLERLCHEYLPLTFSRRHGDPSRPWNRFSIPARQPDGARVIGYEGNWRDIFQNWEALAHSFPGYATSMVCKFANASTADGYNPYRITQNGIDWEVVEPHDPWSFIGYWGDHQIIYLLRLLELLERHEPAKLRHLLTREMFSYANVPYRIKPYADLRKNPKDTVVFDRDLEAVIQHRVRRQGSDGKLLWNKNGAVRLVNLTEKFLVSLLAKLSNFVPDAGIWLNTQRPEWNDANNALVGNGASMVTVYYLRRMFTFCLDVFASAAETEFSIATEVATHLAAVQRILTRLGQASPHSASDQARSRLTDELGEAASRYRVQVYSRGFSGHQRKLPRQVLLDFFALARAAMDAAIGTNRRADGLYHSYNLLSLASPQAISIRRLYEMLEGQVAVLSSGRLSPEASLAVLTALKRSPIYRADQHSYLLYPDRALPRFTERNHLPPAAVRRSALLRKLLVAGNRELVARDVAGKIHFNAAITNARDVQQILDRLASTGHAALVRRDTALVLDLFERLFDHASFTGRSGTFFGYEGLGCIYWHMVSKLLLAAQESYLRAAKLNPAHALLPQLAACYHDLRAGIGDRKSPEVYGGFPMDPYSHTPGHAGARQPGLTGQVKEDVIGRWGELGVSVAGGQLHFEPLLLHAGEFLATPSHFRYFDVSGTERRIRLPAHSLAFTYCQTLVIYHRQRANSVTLIFTNGSRQKRANLHLDAEASRLVFERTGQIRKIIVALADPDNHQL